MPFKLGPDPNRGPGPAPGTGGRPSNAERERARYLVQKHKVLERLAQAAGRAKPNVPAARTLLQVANLLIEQHEHEHSGTIEFEEAARSFESRNSRLIARLGTAAVPEWPE